MGMSSPSFSASDQADRSSKFSLAAIWQKMKKFFSTLISDDQKISRSEFERAFQDWIVPQMQTKSIFFLLLSVLCVSFGFSVFVRGSNEMFDKITELSFSLSLSVMPYIFSCSGLIFVVIPFFPQVVEQQEHYVTALLWLVGMVFVPAGSILVNVSEYGASNMVSLLLYAHVLSLTLLYYHQGVAKTLIASGGAFVFVIICNSFITIGLQYHLSETLQWQVNYNVPCLFELYHFSMFTEFCDKLLFTFSFFLCRYSRIFSFTHHSQLST